VKKNTMTFSIYACNLSLSDEQTDSQKQKEIISCSKFEGKGKYNKLFNTAGLELFFFFSPDCHSDFTHLKGYFR